MNGYQPNQDKFPESTAPRASEIKLPGHESDEVHVVRIHTRYSTVIKSFPSESHAEAYLDGLHTTYIWGEDTAFVWPRDAAEMMTTDPSAYTECVAEFGEP
jgi:hypothetical protein